MTIFWTMDEEEGRGGGRDILRKPVGLGPFRRERDGKGRAGNGSERIKGSCKGRRKKRKVRKKER